MGPSVVLLHESRLRHPTPRKAGRPMWAASPGHSAASGDPVPNSLPSPCRHLHPPIQKRGETVVFAWIVFRSRADRDRVNAMVAKDPRLAKVAEPKGMPFDPRRMTYGGSRILVDA